MSTIGHGYGSEWHLLRWLGYPREELSESVAKGRTTCSSSLTPRGRRFNRPMTSKRNLDEPVIPLRRRPIADRLASTVTLGLMIDRKGRIS